VAVAGRAVQHGVHTEPVRDIAGPVLGHHRPVHVPDQDEPETGVPADRRRVGVQRGHQLPGHHLVAASPHRTGAQQHVSVHQQHRVPDILVHHIVLRSAAGHGVHVLQDLHGGRHADPVPKVGHQSAVVHPVVRRRFRQRQRRRRKRWRKRQWRRCRWRSDGADAADTPGRRHDHVRVGRRRRGLHASAPAAKKLLAQPKTEQAIPREEGGQDVGHRHGRVHRLLAAVLRRQPVVRVLRRELRVQGPAAVVRGRLARMDQQRHEPRDLRLLEPRLSQVSRSRR